MKMQTLGLNETPTNKMAPNADVICLLFSTSSARVSVQLNLRGEILSFGFTTRSRTLATKERRHVGRFLGKRPDPTAKVTRAAGRYLEPEEQVFSALYVQQPGTATAEFSAAAGGASAGAAGIATSFNSSAGVDRKTAQWLKVTAELGVDPVVARRTLRMFFVLTDARMVLIRRSRLTLRPKELVGAWPINDVERIRVHKGSRDLRITLAASELRLELPADHRFLPDAYREVTSQLAAAKVAQT